MDSLQQYKVWRDSMARLLERGAEVCAAISTEHTKFFTSLRNKLCDDALKIQIVGCFNTGKTTFINAMIGEDVLPVDIIPCTAVVSEVKYSPKKKAAIHFRNPLPLGLIDYIPASTREYIKEHNMGREANGAPCQIPPLQISFDRISEYVAITEPPSDILFDEDSFHRYIENFNRQCPYEKVSLFHPAYILRDGVEIVDTPGFVTAH